MIAPAQGQKVDLNSFKNLKARSIGPAGMSGRVTAIDVVLNNDDIIYVGSASGGLWKSESGGIDWEPIFDKERVGSIGSISIYQKNPSIIWVGTGEGNPRNSQTNGYGVYKSIDAGRTWTYVGLGETRNIHRIIVHPENPDVVYVGAQGAAWGDDENRGVFKTTDGGKSWQKILYKGINTGVGDMIMDPSNPDKLMVAMWEFKRWPWFFKSGGPTSGLHMTYDGGKTWKEITSKDGLPKGELGRIGLAMGTNKTNVVYAIVESKKNALYRSDDGGHSWRMTSNKSSIGNRPFYYFDIYVDPQNENRLYSIHSIVTYSEDGGKDFKPLMTAYGRGGIHPDHHAWWIHPEKPDFMIDGNDGGMAITRDGGKTWRFVETLPLAQFYHVNYDLEIPYNVYGGLQDNGSWIGPAYTWQSGGIRNAYWEELFFGDGFDVQPYLPDVRYGYAMSQGGNLGRYDRKTGNSISVRPVHPDGTFLRFNWNAALAQDPFDVNTIYYGSQFLHKSTDKGDNWKIISPDLTTNDTTKQKQLESGGLTYDATQAENNTTIVSIAPSPVDKNVIWVGTDDGNLQLTTDGGENWKNLISKLKDAPEAAWIPQIVVSEKNAGEAFVVINNYRQHDYGAYVYHTKNFGKSWNRLIDNDDVWGYVLSIVQDPVEPKLLFAGTEYGLYVSFDEGENWNKWTHGYPSFTSTMDLKIHPREHDLVIGTFGRSIYILDDIRPLRALASEGVGIMKKDIQVFDPPIAYQAEYRQATGTRFEGNSIFAGENRRGGAMISYYVQEGPSDEKSPAKPKDGEEKKKKPGKVKVEILDTDNKLIRTLMAEPDSGFNRIYWDMEEKGIRMPGQPEPKPGSSDRGGLPVMPGTYKVKMSYMGSMDSTNIEVQLDPRIDYNIEGLQERRSMAMSFMEKVAEVTEATDRLKKAEESMGMAMKLMPEDSTAKEVKAQVKDLKKSMKSLKELIFQKEDIQGILRSPNVLQSTMFMALRSLSNGNGAPTDQQRMVVKQAEEKMAKVMEQYNDFFEGDWAKFKESAGQLDLSPFKE